MPQNTTTNSPATKRSFWAKYRILIITTFSFFGIVAIVVTAIFLNKPAEQVTVATQQESSSSKAVLVDTTNAPKIVDLSFLSFDKDESDQIRAKIESNF